MINRITIHHTGGAHTPNATDLNAYHFVVDGAGKVHDGRWPVSANVGRLSPGRYAAHTLGLNTGNIGVSMAAMHGGQWGNPRASKAFPTTAQVDATVAHVATLADRYGIRPDRRFILTHAEVQTTLGITQRQKWDFDYDPYGLMDTRDPVRIGDMLRGLVTAHMGGPPQAHVPETRRTLRRGATGEDVRALQAALSVAADGAFGPATDAAVRAFQRRNELLPDGVVGPTTWAALSPDSP